MSSLTTLSSPTTNQNNLEALQPNPLNDQTPQTNLQGTTSPTLPALQPSTGITPSTAPTLQTYIDEAKKLGISSFDATRQLLNQDYQESAEGLSRQLYGQNVGLESGIGQKNIEKFLQTRADRLAPYAQQTATQIGQTALQQYYNAEQQKRDTTLRLLEEGKIQPTEETNRLLSTYGLPTDIKNQLQVTGEQQQQALDLQKQQADAQRTAIYGTKEDGSPYTSDQEAQAAWSQKTATQELGLTYGNNPATGQPFKSKAEAENYWMQQGFNQSLISKYGINPNTGNPFTSEKEASEFWNVRGFDKALTQKYGMNPLTGKPFESEIAASNYYEQQGFNQALTQKFGINPLTNLPFTSEAEAQQYWDDQGYSKEMMRKFGINEETGRPFTSEQQAAEYWVNKGFNNEIALKYGMNPENDRPFTSEAEAQNYWNKQGYLDEIVAKYGTNDQGKPFKSSAEADQYWQDKGYNSTFLHKYGMNPSTGKPFDSEQQAVDYYNQQQTRNVTEQDILSKYGVRDDGSKFTSYAEAEDYWDAQRLNFKYGKKDTGESFNSELEAIKYWENKGFKNTLIEKYGLNPETGEPFPNEQMAVDYWEQRGFESNITKKYGLSSNGQPYASEAEALKDQERKDLENKLQGVPEGIAANINSIDEYQNFLERGKTYEQEVLDIVEDAKSLNDWDSRVPELESLLAKYNSLYTRENAMEDGFITFGPRKDPQLVDKYDLIRTNLQQILADIKAGIVPVVDNVDLLNELNGQAPLALKLMKSDA